MNERQFGAELRRYLDGFGPYDRRHSAPVFSEVPRRRSGGRHLLAAGVVCLTVAAVVAALLVPRLLGTAHTSTPDVRPLPRATASPSPTPAPAVLLVPGRPGYLRLSWDGQQLGSFEPSGSAAFMSTPAPDGSMVLRTSFGQGGSQLISGEDGHLIGTLPQLGIPDSGLATRWADDSRHICAVNVDGAALDLMVASVDPVRGETGVRAIPIAGITPDVSVAMDACSFRTDRAVVSRFQEVGGAASGIVDVLRLYDGAVLLHRDFPAPSPFVNVFASSDALFLAGSPSTQPVRETFVVDLTTGQQVARLQGAGFAFSSDDRYLAVSSLATEIASPGGTGSLVDWRTGRSVWQAPGQLAIIGVQPDGDAFAVQLYQTVGGSLQSRSLIVRPDGTTLTIPS